MSDRMKVTVDRSEWARGKGSIGSGLKRFDGTKCCLGFACEQFMGVELPKPPLHEHPELTYPDTLFAYRDMRDNHGEALVKIPGVLVRGLIPQDNWTGIIEELQEIVKGSHKARQFLENLTTALRTQPLRWSAALARINDSEDFTEPMREKLLTKLFNCLDIDIEFVDGAQK